MRCLRRAFLRDNSKVRTSRKGEYKKSLLTESLDYVCSVNIENFMNEDKAGLQVTQIEKM